MPADPLPSLLITPDLRRRLQQRYEEALRLLGQPHPDHARIHELLADCLQADPGSILYLEALLANLRRWQPVSGRSWLARFLGTPQSPALNSSPQMALQEAPTRLREAWNDPAVLRSLAASCAAYDFDDTELVYLQAALQSAPDDVETLRMLARTLTRQGRFAEAAEIWQRLVAAAPDAEAAQALQDLQLAPESTNAGETPAVVSTHPASVVEAIAAAHQLSRGGQFAVAEELLSNAQAIFGGDLSIRQAIEELQLARSENALRIARRRAAQDDHPRAQSLVSRMEPEHLHLEIEILNLRCERLPGDQNLRLELARRLKRAGNYSGAIQRLEEITVAPSEDQTQARSACEGPNLSAAILIELGECWQHLRQFAKAFDLYVQAANAAFSHTDEHRLARYRAATLAAAMHRLDEARAHLTALIALDPGYKDARERLDKLDST